MEPVEILKREHRAALLVAKAARRDLKGAGETGEISAERTEQILDFFRYFTNSCHEPKEEDLLFTVLHRRGLPWDGYPLQELVRDHQAMRVVLDSASDRLPLARDGDAIALMSLGHDLEVYLRLLERHIAAEEQALFPMVQERLTTRDLTELGDAFTAIACEELQEGVHAYYADLAHDLLAAART